MGTSFFYEFKRQASFFLREKVKHARLALTDVTPAELLTEEITNGNPWAPDARTMGFISRAAFEIDDFWRIVGVLHKRLAKLDLKQWRESYNSLVLLDHLLTHGPESVADEFLCDRETIQKLGDFNYIDERGFNWGLAVRKKSVRVLNFLEKGPAFKEERDRARKLTRGIHGFGSMDYRLTDRCKMNGHEHMLDSFGRCNSHYESSNLQDDEVSETKKLGSDFKDKIIMVCERSMEKSIDNNVYDKLEDRVDGNIDDEEDEKKELSSKEVDDQKIEFQEEEHPFVFNEHNRMESTLLLSQS